MPSHMSVQRTAIKRNALSEIFIDFTLQKFSEKMLTEGLVSEPPSLERQKSFNRNDCQDVYDHYLELHLNTKSDPNATRYEIWAQTTCYKGNATGKPESNKTYEIRETLSEALTLRRWLRHEQTPFRTIHFTLGPANYTYGWFETVKNSAFDLSLYPVTHSDIDFFTLLEDLGQEINFEFEMYERLEQLLEDYEHPLSQYVNNTVSALVEYFSNGFPECDIANKQSDLLQNLRDSAEDNVDEYILASKNTGMNIKGKAIRLLEGESINDECLNKTLKRLIQTNPFLPIALDALTDWNTWSKNVFLPQENATSLNNYLNYLWGITSENKHIIHRLLMRAYTSESINYIQDLNIDGISEHNLYNTDHTTNQRKEICRYLEQHYIKNGYNTPTLVFNRLISNDCKNLILSSLKFEQINGTSLKPSFYYLEEYLLPRFKLITFQDAGLEKPTAYYKAFASDLNVRNYDNLKIIYDTVKNANIAIVKGKFFRQPEFPRRVKEESYVGLTTKYSYINDNFSLTYPGLPLIMFIDMADSYTPPAFAIRRIISYGWLPFFELSELKLYLETQVNQ